MKNVPALALALLVACSAQSADVVDASITTTSTHDASSTARDAPPGATVTNVACNMVNTLTVGTSTTRVQHFAWIDGLATTDTWTLEFCGGIQMPAPAPCGTCVSSGDPLYSTSDPGACDRLTSGKFFNGRLFVDCGYEQTTSTGTTSFHWTSIKIYR